MNIFDELNPLLTSEPSASNHIQKTFDVDNGRLTCKAKWVKISDSSDVGPHIVKILNLSCTNAGKYFLKINVKLGSYLDRIVSELEQKNKTVHVKNKSKEPSRSSHNSSKHKKCPSTFNDNASVIELSAEDLNHDEEYIPFSAACASSFLNEKDDAGQYNPERKASEIEMNKIKSKYAPTYVTDKPKTNDAVYKPVKKETKSTDTVLKSKKRLNKSKELFGSSESHKPKRKLDLSPKRESSKERSKSKKKKLQDIQSINIADSDINIR